MDIDITHVVFIDDDGTEYVVRLRPAPNFEGTGEMMFMLIPLPRGERFQETQRRILRLKALSRVKTSQD